MPDSLVKSRTESNNCGNLRECCHVKDENFTIIHDPVCVSPDATGDGIVDVVITGGTSDKILSTESHLAMRCDSNLYDSS